jgi:hypothetical protein
MTTHTNAPNPHASPAAITARLRTANLALGPLILALRCAGCDTLERYLAAQMLEGLVNAPSAEGEALFCEAETFAEAVSMLIGDLGAQQ